MTLDEAFEDMLVKRWVLLSPKTRYKWRARKKVLTETKKRQILNKHGYKVYAVEKWAKL